MTLTMTVVAEIKIQKHKRNFKFNGAYNHTVQISLEALFFTVVWCLHTHLQILKEYTKNDVGQRLQGNNSAAQSGGFS